MIIRKNIIMLFIIMVATNGYCQHVDFVGDDNAPMKMSKLEAFLICTLKKPRWSSGVKIFLIMYQPGSSQQRSLAYEFGLTPKSLSIMLARAGERRAASKPDIAKDEKDAIRKVEKLYGGFTFIPSAKKIIINLNGKLKWVLVE